MDKRLRAWLEQNGLRADADEKTAWDTYAQLRADGIILEGFEDAQPDAAAPAAGGDDGSRGDEPAPAVLDTDVQAQIDAAVRQARVDDLAMRAAIDERLQVAGFTAPEDAGFRASILSDPNMTTERATDMIFKRLQTHNPAIGAGASVTVGTEDRDKVRDAVTDALLLRSGLDVDTPAPGAGEFRGRSLIEIGRELLERSGTVTRGLSKRQVTSMILSNRGAGGSLSTSDFPLILSNLVNKTLLKAYMEWPQTWKPFVSVTDATDFKAIHSLRLSGSPDLKGLNEQGEYRSADFSEKGETYAIITKGLMTKLTRQMMINDDLRAFTRIPQLFAVAARRMEADAVYSLITGNPTMSDGKTLFHADHKNLASSGAPVGNASLSAGRASMRTQEGLAGETIDVQAAFLLVPTVKETDAEIMLRSPGLPEDNKSAGVTNPWNGKLTPIADPHLDAVSEDAWYLLAHPSQVALIEVAYLEGERQPYVEDTVDFDSDALKIKVRHDFGAGAVDPVAGYKNAGK